MTTFAPRPCSYCGQEFVPTHHRAAYCLPRCRADRDNERHRKNRDPRVLTCCICGAEARTHNVRQVTCAREACREANRRAQRERSEKRRRQRIREAVPPDYSDVVALLCSRWGRAA